MIDLTRRALLVTPALLLTLSACGTSAVAAEDVAAEAESALGEKLDATIEVECPEDLPAEEGAEITCTLTDPATSDTYDMTAVVSAVDGSDVQMNFEVK